MSNIAHVAVLARGRIWAVWNIIYLDAALGNLANIGDPIPDHVARRIPPNGHEHINFLGRYDLNPPTSTPTGALHPIRI